MPDSCPCGLPSPYDDCCGRYHRGTAEAPTAERLMRARYSAFVRCEPAYLQRSWHPSTRPGRVNLDRDTEWLGLEIRGTTGGGLLDTEGTVDFRAGHRRGGHDGTVEEHSRFTRHDGRWVYVGPAAPAD